MINEKEIEQTTHHMLPSYLQLVHRQYCFVHHWGHGLEPIDLRRNLLLHHAQHFEVGAENGLMTGEDLVAKKKPVSYSSPGSRLAQQKHTSDQGTGVPSGLGLEFGLAGTPWATSSSTVGFMAGLNLGVMLKLKIGSYSAPRVRLRRWRASGLWTTRQKGGNNTE